MSNNFSQNNDKNIKKVTSLDKAQLNCPYVITQNNLPQNLQTRFSELGFVKGAKVTVIKKAPMGDPLEISIMGYSLCARANELKHVNVEEIHE